MSHLFRLLLIGLAFGLPLALGAADPGPPYVVLEYDDGKPGRVLLGRADPDGVRVEYGFPGPREGLPKAVAFPTRESPSRGRVFVAVSPEDYKAIRALALGEAASDRGGDPARLVSGIAAYLDLRLPAWADLRQASRFLQSDLYTRPGGSDRPGPLVIVAPVGPRESAGAETPAVPILPGGEVVQQQWLERIRAQQAQAQLGRKQSEAQERQEWLARQAEQAAADRESAARLRERHDDLDARFGERFDEQLARTTARMDQRSAALEQQELQRQAAFRARLALSIQEARENLEKIIRMAAGDPSAAAAPTGAAKPPAPAPVPANTGTSTVPSQGKLNLGNPQLTPPSLPPSLAGPTTVGELHSPESQRGKLRLLDDITLRPPVALPRTGDSSQGSTVGPLPLDAEHSVVDLLKTWKAPSDFDSRSKLYRGLFDKPYEGSGPQNRELLHALKQLEHFDRLASDSSQAEITLSRMSKIWPLSYVLDAFAAHQPSAVGTRSSTVGPREAKDFAKDREGCWRVWRDDCELAVTETILEWSRFGVSADEARRNYYEMTSNPEKYGRVRPNPFLDFNEQLFRRSPAASAWLWLTWVGSGKIGRSSGPIPDQGAWRSVKLSDASPDELLLWRQVRNAETVVVGRTAAGKGHVHAALSLDNRNALVLDSWLNSRGIPWSQRWQDIFNRSLFDRTSLDGRPVYVMSGGGYTLGEVAAAEAGARVSGITNVPYWPSSANTLGKAYNWRGYFDRFWRWIETASPAAPSGIPSPLPPAEDK